MTKVFTTAILAMRIQQKRVESDSPLKPSYLPPGFKLSSNEENVTLQQLATFTGGFDWSDPPCCKTNKNPVPVYSQNQFVDAVNHLNPTKKDGPGTTDLPTYMKYSNGSVGFLGQILMYIDGFPLDPIGFTFGEWIRVNLTEPLGMNNTHVYPPGTYATGYKLSGTTYEPQDPFPWEPWGASGGLRSSANDMLKFLKANICAWHQSDPSCTGLPKNVLDALFLAHLPESYTPPGNPNILVGGKSGGPNEQAMAWVYNSPSNPSGTPIIQKNGGHPGFSSFIGFDPVKKYGLVILMNTRQKALTNAGINIIQQTPK